MIKNIKNNLQTHEPQVMAFEFEAFFAFTLHWQANVLARKEMNFFINLQLQAQLQLIYGSKSERVSERERHVNRYMRQVYKYGGAAAVAISHFANIENSIAQCRCNDGDFLIALLFSTH